VVAALARGVIAVECPSRSGTLITTSIAANLGRTVMAIPGRIDSRSSAGCLKLIRDGAILIRNVDDVLEAMSELLPAELRKESAQEPAPAQERDSLQPRYSVEESMVMLHVEPEGVTIDELSRLTKLPVAKVNSVVMTLRVKGFVRFLPGNRVAPARNV
jgi:DNA processing protein